MAARLKAVQALANISEAENGYLEHLKTGSAGGYGRIRRIAGSMNELLVDVLLAQFYASGGLQKSLAEYGLGILHGQGLGSGLSRFPGPPDPFGREASHHGVRQWIGQGGVPQGAQGAGSWHPRNDEPPWDHL